MIEFKTLSQTSNQDILHCFNEAFSDYVIPFKLNLEQLEAKLITESIDKAFSMGAFRDQKLRGFVLHGVRKVDNIYKAYNAGTGVIPTERGQGLTQSMYDFIKPILKSKAFEEVVLEVISNNTPALKSYEKIGFKPIRNLSCFKGELHIPEVHRDIEIRQSGHIDLEELSKMGEIEPTWQNSQETIRKLGKSALCFLAYLDTKLCGYAIINSNNNRILQIAVKQDFRNQAIGSSLLEAIKNKVSGPVSMINVDSNYPEILNFLERKNLKKYITQEEMKLKIAH